MRQLELHAHKTDSVQFSLQNAYLDGRQHQVLQRQSENGQRH